MATVATLKNDVDDWSVPGRIYVAKLPEDPSTGVELEVLCDGLYRNHGFWQTKENEKDAAFIGNDQGILQISAPEKRNGQWKVEPILPGPIEEVATIGMDGDVQGEIITIEEFHENTIQIYKKEENA